MLAAAALAFGMMLAPLAPTGLVEVKVLDAETGEPLQGARVLARSWCKDARPGGRAVTGTDGVARVARAGAGVTFYTVQVERAGYVPVEAAWTSPADDHLRSRDVREAPASTYAVRLPRGVRIGGRVVDARGRGVADARVVLGVRARHEPDNLHVAIHHGWVRTDAEGRWHHDGAPADVGEATLCALSPLHPIGWPKRQGIDRRDDADAGQLRAGTHVTTLADGVTVRGAVRDARGGAVADAHVFAADLDDSVGMPRVVVTDAQGLYLLTVFPGEPTTLHVAAPGFRAAALPLDAACEARMVDVTLARQE